LAALLLVAAAQLSLRLAGRNLFPFDFRLAVAVSLLTVPPLLGSMPAGRKGLYGPAALIAALTSPTSLVATFVALLAALYAGWCCTDVLFVIVAFVPATLLFLATGITSVVARQAYLDSLQRESTANSEADE
jgi:hypothetical protein